LTTIDLLNFKGSGLIDALLRRAYCFSSFETFFPVGLIGISIFSPIFRFTAFGDEDGLPGA